MATIDIRLVAWFLKKIWKTLKKLLLMEKSLVVITSYSIHYTKLYDEDFVRVLSTADALLLAEVYPAGEAPIVAADGRSLARAVRVAGRVEPIFVERIDALAAEILRVARDGDVVVTMGAGSIGAVPAQLLGREG